MKQKAERDYSGRSLFEKLGLFAAARAALVGDHDEWFAAALAVELDSAASRSLRAQYDLIFLKVIASRDLARVASAAAHLKPNGALWIFHPKGRGATPSDGEVRATGLAAGLVDNKISAYSDSHTATRFVIPLSSRAPSRDSRG